jgi:PAS domain S-box-containing protein
MKTGILFNRTTILSFFLGGSVISTIAAFNNKLSFDAVFDIPEWFILPFLVGSIPTSAIAYLVQAKQQVLMDLLQVEHSEKEKLETIVADTEKRSRLWLEHSPVCSKIVDLDYNLRFMSQAGVSGLDVDDVSELYGKPYPLDFYPQTFKEEMISNLNKARDTGKIVEQEAPVTSLSGEEIWFHSSIVPVKDETGKLDYFLIVSSDVTEHKKMEEDLQNALVDAEQANQSKSAFLASMSHELRTPLNAVLGFAQMMQLDNRDPLSPDQKKHAESIVEGGNHLLELVNEILDLARVEADQIELSLSKVDVKEVVADCVNLIFPLGEPRGIKIVDQFSKEPSALLLTDQTRLKQALINLLSNAVKFNKDDGTVTIDGKEVVPGFLRISVTDTGKGIPKDDYSSIFDLFHRLDADPMIATEGTGIGLTVTKLLVERMAGRIGFESELGVGSTFWIDLPLASNEDVLI